MYRYTNDEEKKELAVKQDQLAGVREDEGTVVDGVFTVAPQFSGSQVRDIATRYRAANPNSGDYYMHDGVKYSYADLVQPAQKPVQDAPMREPKGYYQKVNGGVVSGGRFIADDNLTKEEAEQAAIAYGDSVGNDDAYYYQYGGKVRKAKKSLFARPDVKKPEVIDTTGYAELHRVNNGTVVDGLFVADDNLSADAARNVALRYYLSQQPKGNAFYYQHNGKIYVTDKTQRADTKNVPEGEKPAPVKVLVESPAPQPAQSKPTQQVQPVQQVKQEAKPVATTETKPAQQTVATEVKPATQQVQNQEAKPAPAPQVNTQQAQEKGKEKGGFFNAVGGFLGDVKDNVSEFAEGVRDNMQARKVQRELEGREIPEPQRPVLGTPTKGRIDAQEAARFKESSKDITPVANWNLEGVNRQIADAKIEFVDGGFAVDGYFIADDNLSQGAATSAAKKYYAGKHNDYTKNYGPTKYHDRFQWKGVQYTTKEKEGSALRKKISIVNGTDLAKYRKLREDKAKYEAELPEKPVTDASKEQVAPSEPSTSDASLENVVSLIGTGGEPATVAQGGATQQTTQPQPANTQANTNATSQPQQATAPAQTSEAKPASTQTTPQTATTQPQQTNSTTQNTTTPEVVATGEKADTNNNTTTTTSAGKTDVTTKAEEPKRFSDLFSESRKALQQKKTDAAKMQKYYALADALKVIGDMGGTAIGGAIGGDALGGATPTEQSKPSRGYIEAFEKAKAADEALAKLDQEEYKLEVAYEKKKEEREYKAAQAAILQEYKIELEKLRREGINATEEKKAELREKEILLRANCSQSLAELKSTLKYNNDLSLLDERAEDQMDIIDYRTNAQKDVIDYRIENGLYDSRRSRETKPVRFRDGTNMEIPLTYYESMKQDLIGDDWNGKRVTKDNVEQYIRNNPNVVKDYLRGFGVEVGASTPARTSSTPAPATTPAPASAPAPSTGSGTNTSRQKSTDEILDAL